MAEWPRYDQGMVTDGAAADSVAADGPAAARGVGDAAGADYRIDELAREAGTTVRNVRAYQDRGLLPPPRRAGRVGLYSESHLARLRLIGELLGRGYTLSNIAEMVDSWERGQDLSELLGLESALIGPWSDERAAPVDLEQLTELFGKVDDREVIDGALAAGLIEISDGEVRMKNPKLLEAAAILVHHGVPLPELLTVAQSVTEAVDQIASAFVGLIVRNVFDRLESPIPASEVPRLAELVRQMRPVARSVVDSELARAMERRIQIEMGEQFVRDQKNGVNL
jgi:DNA-binding transcriptional MerR regulator